MPSQPSVALLLRDWRRRRRLSQLELACLVDVSTRHLSFMETGRARPSREMLLRIAERLEIPLRGRNALLLAAGYAPEYPEHALDDPALAEARRAVELVLAGHEPYPALAVDRHWTLAAANRALAPLLAGVAPALLRPPVNVLRLSLHPEGVAPRIVNYAQWRAHALERLRQQVETTADPVLAALREELAGYPAPDGATGAGDRAAATSPTAVADGVVVPLRIRTEQGVLSFIGTTTIFGTPVDVTLAELAIESFFPADEATAEALRRTAATAAAGAAPPQRP